MTERVELAKSQAQSKKKVSLEDLFAHVQAGEAKGLNLIVKADVQGSLNPIVSELNKLGEGAIGIKVLYSEAGNIGENDVMLASASNAIIIGFNVQADVSARRLAEKEGVDIRLYEIIYRMTEDIEKALNGMLEPEVKEQDHWPCAGACRFLLHPSLVRWQAVKSSKVNCVAMQKYASIVARIWSMKVTWGPCAMRRMM